MRGENAVNRRADSLIKKTNPPGPRCSVTGKFMTSGSYFVTGSNERLEHKESSALMAGYLVDKELTSRDQSEVFRLAIRFQSAPSAGLERLQKTRPTVAVLRAGR
jgi:hypothetical protein